MPAMPLRTLLAVSSFACLLPGALPHAAGAPPPSPLGLQPAEAVYLGNDSPFVLFDVAPRTIERRPRAHEAGDRAITVAFLAVDSLHSVHMTPFVPGSPPGAGPGAGIAARRVSCGAKIAGYHACSVPVEEVLAMAAGKEERIGLRIEAEGLDGDRSTVEVSLPLGRPPHAATSRRMRAAR